MFAFLITLFITWVCMWGFFKFMYPKPPKAFMPQEGDIVTSRNCDYCGHPLAEYRGVLEQKPLALLTDTMLADVEAIQHQLNSDDDALAKYDNQLKTASRVEKKAIKQALKTKQQERFAQQQKLKQQTTWFFCNHDHQAAFHANDTHQ